MRRCVQRRHLSDAGPTYSSERIADSASPTAWCWCCSCWIRVKRESILSSVTSWDAVLQVSGTCSPTSAICSHLFYCFFNPLECKGNYSATSNNMTLAHWPLMGGLLRLVQRGGDWAIPNVTAHPSTVSVSINVLLNYGSLIFGFDVSIKDDVIQPKNYGSVRWSTSHSFPNNFCQ